MIKKRITFWFPWMVMVCLFKPHLGMAWNALGHRLVAQIAHDKLNEHAVHVFERDNQALNVIYKPTRWVDAAVWLDTLRYQDVNWYAFMHYIDLPFSEDNTPLPPLQKINAVWAIQNASRLLLNRYATSFDRGIALRILLHVVGDLHQPLHTITHVSSAYPKGDKGGNLVRLQQHAGMPTLHAYWDKGAGLLMTKKVPPKQLKQWAARIEQHWPCDVFTKDINPMHWARESHMVAVDVIYGSLKNNPMNAFKYQSNDKKIAEQQIARAGCRLAALLNQLDKKRVKSNVLPGRIK